MPARKIPSKPPFFTSYDVQRWKRVSAHDTARIANASCSGIDWTNCPKRDIYSTFVRGTRLTGKIDSPKFVKLMDEAAEITTRLKKEIFDSITRIIRE